MTKKSIVILTLYTLTSFTAVAQYKQKVSINLGISYIFNRPTEKNALKNLAISTGVHFSTSDYFYLGPKLQLSNIGVKSSTYIDLGPEAAFNFWRFGDDKIFTKPNEDYRNADMFLSTFLGFSLDKNTVNKKRLMFTNTTISVGLSSKKLAKNSLYLNYAGNILINRESTDKLYRSLGLGIVTDINK